ncbi:MAG: DUF3160 domain-containing protein [Synergistaceae bacterium]|nr:DUF3160 domain-containing protein [Synergistaceae bacterium]
MRRFLFALACAVALLCASAAGAAQKYIVTGRLVPIFENTRGAKTAPKGGWVKVSAEDSALAYGDVVEGTPAKDKKWLSLAGEMTGYVELALLTPMPKYTAFEARPFQVLKDGVVPHLLPGKLPTSEYSKFALPRGAVVTAEGKAEANGASWVLCAFGTDYAGVEDDAEAAGSDRRCAWLKESDLRDLQSSKPDLSRVEEGNLPGSIKGDARKYILKNGFYVDPSPTLMDSFREDDMVDLYKDLDSHTAKFITADLPFHALHLYFDRALQKVEEKALVKRTADLVTAMRNALRKQPKAASDLERTARANVSDFLDLALYLITNGGSTLPKGIRDFAEAVMSAEGAGDNPFTEMPQDFSFFGPRGHYTLNDDLKAYFRATYLLGTGWPLESETGAAATLILNKLLAVPDVQRKWRLLYDPITTLVGGANVNSPETFAKVLAPFKFSDLGKPARVEALLEALDNAGKDSAIQKLSGKKFAILPRRITFDAFIFHTLTYPDTPKRGMPDPLDVMAVLGSKPAADEVKQYAKFDGYAENQKKLIDLWPSYADSKDGKNFYTSVLSAMRTYIASKGSKQFFAKTPAWGYKKLTTAEGAMTELKHDTILYAEQSGAELGEGADDWVAGAFLLPIPRGYVEPVPELFDALGAAARNLAKTLNPLLPDENEYVGEYYRTQLTDFAESMDTLSGIARRARDDAMTYDDFQTILDFGLPSVLPEGIFEVYDEEAQNMLKMALVADVATDAVVGEVLYMASGAPRKLHVYVNDKSGGFRVTEGFVYSYYTFSGVMLDHRMNDDDWKAKVYGKEDLTEFLPYWNEKLYQ